MYGANDEGVYVLIKRTVLEKQPPSDQYNLIELDLWKFEKKAYGKGFKKVAGIDEAGRGKDPCF